MFKDFKEFQQFMIFCHTHYELNDVWHFENGDKGILFEGDYLPSEEFNKIANLPSKEESITKFAMMIKSPMQNLAMMLKSSMSDFVNVLNNIKENKSS